MKSDLRLETLLNEAKISLSLGLMSDAYIAFNALAYELSKSPNKEFLKKYGSAILKLERGLREAYKKAKKNPGLSKKDEKLWKHAKKIAETRFNKKEKNFSDDNWAYTTGIFKHLKHETS